MVITLKLNLAKIKPEFIRPTVGKRLPVIDYRRHHLYFLISEAILWRLASWEMKWYMILDTSTKLSEFEATPDIIAEVTNEVILGLVRDAVI